MQRAVLTFLFLWTDFLILLEQLTTGPDLLAATVSLFLRKLRSLIGHPADLSSSFNLTIDLV